MNIRIHSECVTGDVFKSSRCDCGDQLYYTIDLMSDTGGIILYFRQEGRGIGLNSKLEAYSLQDSGYDTFEANEKLGFKYDCRSYLDAVKMLQALNIKKVILHTNNPEKTKSLSESGIEIIDVKSTPTFLKSENINYLKAKSKKGHNLKLQGYLK